MFKDYQRRSTHFMADSDRMDRFNSLLVKIRTVVFIFSVFFITFLVESRSSMLWPGLFSLCAFFAALLIIHEWIIRKRDRFKTLYRINEFELAKLLGKFDSNYPGTEFIDPAHPYTSDLDIFGKGSLYQYINRTNTHEGRKCLAEWLKGACEEDEILLRQDAVRCLSGKLDWRQEFQTIGILEEEAGNNPDNLVHWTTLNPVLSKSLPLRIILTVLRLVIPLSLLFLPLNQAVLNLVFSVIIVNLAVILFSERYVSEVYSRTQGMSRTLRSYIDLFEHISGEEFESDKLNGLKRSLTVGKALATDHIRRLSRLLGWLDLRKSMLHLPFNMFFLWDLYFVEALERWKIQTGNTLTEWIKIIAEYEAICSLSVLYFDNPDWCFPEIDRDYFIFSARRLGHPLIIKEKRVCNDYSQSGENAVSIVTGSNMSGKSTFLRTIGVNLVLGLCGGPVCAEECTVTPVSLYTGMSTKDSLEKGVSSFYAELERIKMVLDAMHSGRKIYMLFDEILKGTNSEDGHAGAVALLKQFIASRVFCVIATHDLNLGRLHESFEDEVKNYCFNGTVVQGNLSFDYRLNPGICQCRNAIALMRIMGIHVQEENGSEF